jgi:hypothetical protein
VQKRRCDCLCWPASILLCHLWQTAKLSAVEASPSGLCVWTPLPAGAAPGRARGDLHRADGAHPAVGRRRCCCPVVCVACALQSNTCGPGSLTRAVSDGRSLLQAASAFPHAWFLAHCCSCVRDQNGNHVIQKVIECVQPSDPARAMIEVGGGKDAGVHGTQPMAMPSSAIWWVASWSESVVTQEPCCISCCWQQPHPTWLLPADP